MASALLGKITSRVKGHHVYNSDYSVGDKLACHPEPDNRHSKDQNAIAVKKTEVQESEQKKAKDYIIGHVPDALAQVICPLLKNGTVTSMTGEITGEARKAPEGTWVQGGGIELPCSYYLFGNKKHKSQVRKQIREAQSSLYGPSKSQRTSTNTNKAV